MPEQRESSIEEIAKLLRLRKRSNHKTVLLLGSRAGELFRSDYFFENMQIFSHQDFNKMTKIEQFSACYHILTEEQFSEAEIHSILRASFQDFITTKADMCLADMVKKEHFDEIISTNMNDVLEQAFVQVDMKEQREFEALVNMHGHFHERSLSYRIIKIFGDFASRTYTIKGRVSHLDSNQESKNALSHILSRDIIAIGIDPIWDEGILRVISPGQAGTICFVSEESFSECITKYSFLRERRVRYVQGSYDSFMGELHNYLYGELPTNYQLANDILMQLATLSSQVQILQDGYQAILSEIKKIQKERREE